MTSDAPKPETTVSTGYRFHVSRTLITLSIPQGYTLTIGGTLAIAISRYGVPSAAEVWGYVVGAVAAFVLLALVLGRPRGEDIMDAQPRLWAVLNVVPVASVVLGAGSVYLLPAAPLGFLIAGFDAVVAYVLLLAGFLALVRLRSG